MYSLFLPLHVTAQQVEATTTPSAIVSTASPQELLQDKWIHALGQCENPQFPKLKRIVDSNGYYSYGQYMFQMGTWLSYGKAFGATKENIYDADLQKQVVESMLDDGLSHHWLICSRIVKKKLGSYPSEQ